MTAEEIVQSIRSELNNAGRAWNLQFQVSDKLIQDGAWLQVFIESNSTKANGAAERQIIADIESDLSEKAGQELLLISVQKLSPSATN